MPGVPRELAEHKLNADPKVRPVKQSLRPFNEERRRAIAEEVRRLLAAGFIRPIKYSKWMANPVLVEKKKVPGECVSTTQTSTASARRSSSSSCGSTKSLTQLRARSLYASRCLLW